MQGILLGLVNWLTGGFADKIIDLGKAYFEKQISEAEFEAGVRKSAQETAAKIEASWADAAKSIAASTGDMVKSSPILQRAWAAVLFLQVAVLVWYQVGAGAFDVITGTAWPDPGVRLEWAYLLIGAMVGAGPLVFGRGGGPKG